ncbi:hypothetical protein IQ264_22490 [Phormidium sp. LEGE 05292]|uniref:hypothetical protein n=1 Tax=[Phormidium] sp. LEGE 05292 TaxID=767427 RepID=UPI00187FB970|nr:hypothetical protein [Phormidium sp. LEGE 05292]MBE9228196.1 hypothetical protein [Phormidium sp. LEGE 05292]
MQENTQLVIEGFPRSANSFSVAAIQSVQPKPLIIASHLHAAAQIIRAANLSIPTLVLIREPAEAIISLKSLELEISYRFNMEYYGWGACLKSYLKAWIKFYLQVLPYSENYVIGLFDEVTNDFGAIIERLNQRFKTNFATFKHTETNVKRIHKMVGFHSGPSEKREYLKSLFIKEIEEDNLIPLLLKAEYIYREFKILAKK